MSYQYGIDPYNDEQFEKSPLIQNNVGIKAGNLETTEQLDDKENQGLVNELGNGRSVEPPDSTNKAIELVQDRYYCWRLAILYSLVATFIYADQSVLAPNLTQIKREFHFSDREGDAYLGGYINFAFFTIGIPAALLVGYLTPFVDRNRLLFMVVVIGQGPNLLAPLIQAYWQLFIVRFLTGISVGGTFPLVYSILGDLFPPKSRSLVSILIAVALGGGTAVGQVVAGFIGQQSRFGWKLPLLVIAAPNIVIALFVYLTCQDPPRGASEESLRQYYNQDLQFSYQSKMNRKKTIQVLTKPTNIFGILQGLPGCLPWGVIIVYLADYLAQDQGLGVYKATTLTIVFGLGQLVGCIFGGYVGQRLYNYKKFLICLFIGTSPFISILPFLYLFNTNLKQSNFGGLNVLAFVGGFFGGIAGVNIRSILLNVNLPEARGLALALHTSLDDVGKGLGPALNAVMIQRLGRRTTFNISLLGWVVCGCFLLLCSLFVERDVKQMELNLIKNAIEDSEKQMEVKFQRQIELNEMVGQGSNTSLEAGVQHDTFTKEDKNEQKQKQGVNVQL